MALGDRQKQYETLFDYQITDRDAVIIRLDGKNFSRFTDGFDKPFDDRLHIAFIETCKDLLKHFGGCRAIFTASDEISMLYTALASFDRCVRQNYLPFSGRIQKLASIAASIASVRFNHYLSQLIDPFSPLRSKIGKAFFDARVFSTVPTEQTPEQFRRTDDEKWGNCELLNNILWRHQDTIRNSKFLFGRQFFGPKALHKMSGDQIVTKVQKEHQQNWEQLDNWKKFGTLIDRDGNEFSDRLTFAVLRDKIFGHLLTENGPNVRPPSDL